MRADLNHPTFAPAPVGPPPLAEFGHIKRYHDPKLAMTAAKILPGEYYVTTGDELITTVLGSCVSACVWDPEAGVGGMNHFMLPDGQRGPDRAGGAEARYGIFAMEFLINTILKHGGARSRLRTKLAGGGQVVRSPTAVGRENVAFARAYLADEGLPLVGEHVEGVSARRLVFHPLSGRTQVLELSPTEQGDVADQEQQYASTIVSHAPPCGDVELF